jgi:hypothetical protein
MCPASAGPVPERKGLFIVYNSETVARTKIVCVCLRGSAVKNP